MTPEAELFYAICQLKEKNQQIDDWSGKGKGKLCRLVGSFLNASGVVPYFYWNRVFRQAALRWYDPDYRTSVVGVRSAVKI